MDRRVLKIKSHVDLSELEKYDFMLHPNQEYYVFTGICSGKDCDFLYCDTNTKELMVGGFRNDININLHHRATLVKLYNLIQDGLVEEAKTESDEN